MLKIEDPKKAADPDLLELEKMVIEMLEDEEPLGKIREELFKNVQG